MLPILASVPAPAAAEPTEIRASVALPSHHPVVTGGWTVFQQAASAVEAADLRFRLFVGGAFVGPDRTLKALSSEEVDMGFLATPDHPEEFPRAAFLAALSMTGGHGLAAAAAVTEIVLLRCRACRDEFTQRGLVFLGTYSAAPYLLIGKEPLTSAGSLAGRRIRSPGTFWDLCLRELHASPARGGAAGPTDSAGLLTTNRADAVIDVAAALRNPALTRQAKMVTLLPLGGYRGASPFTANLAFWRRLSLSQRAALLAAAPAGLVATTQVYQDQARAALDAAAERGATLLPPDTDLQTAFEKVGESSLVQLAAAHPGTFARKELIDSFREIRARYAGLLGLAPDYETAVSVLKREIFDKLDPATYGVEDASVAEGTMPAGKATPNAPSKSIGPAEEKRP